MDEGISGVGSDRPAFQRLLNAALSPGRLFDTILVDDTSRLSRNQAEAMTTIEKLTFAGIRVIFISQGIDTRSEQANVQMTVHGLVDSLYVKELAKKTHRGLESCALRGLHTGGRCYGYDTVSVGDSESKRLVINEREATVVRRIFEMFRGGVSLKEDCEGFERRARSAAPVKIEESRNVVSECDPSNAKARTLQRRAHLEWFQVRQSTGNQQAPQQTTTRE